MSTYYLCVPGTPLEYSPQVINNVNVPYHGGISRVEYPEWYKGPRAAVGRNSDHLQIVELDGTQAYRQVIKGTCFEAPAG